MNTARLTIRREQMEVMQALAEANFERRLADHLLANYPESLVKLPDGEEFLVSDLFEKKLGDLIRTGIAKAKGYGVTNESSLAAYVALMIDVAPNFDEHRLCEVLLNDQDREPNERVSELLSVLTEKNWDSIRNDYRRAAWIYEPPDVTEVEESREQSFPPNPPESIPTETFMSRTRRGRSTANVEPVQDETAVEPSSPESDL